MLPSPPPCEDEEGAPCPALDAACVTAVLSFVDDAATMGAALRLNSLWRSCARNAALPFWAHLSAERYNALHVWHADAAPLCACAATAVLRSAVARRLRRLDLSGATVCEDCSYEDTTRFEGVRRASRRGVAPATAAECARCGD